MKIAVYTIAKNEASFVERWYESAKEADSIHILDTGSEDKTVTIARDLGVDVARWEFNPWRFDDARNFALTMVPEDTDLCIALDMDEVLVEGWRDHLEQAIKDGVTRPRYSYTWSWNVDGTPGLIYGGDKIHARHGYYWKHPVHEVLTPKDVETQGWYGLEIHHHPDSSKSRSQYFTLLELAVKEDPEDDRNAHYLAREYFFGGRMDEAKAEFERHLSLPKALWRAERARSMRYLYEITQDVEWLFKAYEEDPMRRETRVDLAFYYYKLEDWEKCYEWATKATHILERPLDYLTEAFAWGSMPHDLAAISSYNLGKFVEAEIYGHAALELSPSDARLVDNLKYYRKAAA
jgi:glycosyltransferase involved in cell wall biosynthesis